jgi:hypothetical protein
MAKCMDRYSLTSPILAMHQGTTYDDNVSPIARPEIDGNIANQPQVAPLAPTPQSSLTIDTISIPPEGTPRVPVYELPLI